ncbi:H-NS histone family protein [Rhodobacteraceae bacterium LMO-12]|nr:H-NS histone family protein [Rhodobacteraceae bacterium LMO-JJ12]
MATLNAMSLNELTSLEKKVAKAIAKFEDREKKKALSALKAEARKMGFSLSELTGAEIDEGTLGKPRSTVPPKYANPADKTQTWTGRGRRPAWVREALEAGKSLDDLAI